MKRVLAFVRELLTEAQPRADTIYGEGYCDALTQVEEFIEDELWKEGDE